MITNAPRGVEDWYKDRMYNRRYLENILREKARTYNFEEIITPIFEHTVLFSRGVGETTDIVQKEMYTFTDKGGRSITLKPEGTAGAVRAFIENGLQEYPLPCKLFYITPAFRYEKPQSGRLRQHHQFGVEMIGSSSPLAEIEVISLAYECLKALGINKVTLNINNIGTYKCRDEYNLALRQYLSGNNDKLCKVCRDRMDKNPLRILDCKEELCKSVVSEAPKISDFLDDECKEHFKALKKLLKEYGIPFTKNDKLVRGLDYYTKTVFEFVDDTGLTVCGGGRYDNLVKEIDGKKDYPAVGFGMGLERLLEVIKRLDIELPKRPVPDMFIGHIGDDEPVLKGIKLAKELRDNGYVAEIDTMGRSVRAQMKYADKIGARYIVILGSHEVADNIGAVKRMSTGQDIVSELDIDSLKEILNVR